MKDDKQLKFHSGEDKIEGPQLPVLILGLAKYLRLFLVAILLFIERKEITKCAVEVVEIIFKRKG